MRVTFDTNILVYAIDTDDHRHEHAVDLMTRAAYGDCVQTLRSLAEFFHVVTRREAHRLRRPRYGA